MEEMKQGDGRESGQGVAGASFLRGFRKVIAEVTVELTPERLSCVLRRGCVKFRQSSGLGRGTGKFKAEKGQCD